MTDVIEDARIREHFPALVEAAQVVGSVQIRNRATLAGNLCNASPAADTAPALLAYGASLNLVSADGSRQLPLDEFFDRPGTDRAVARRDRRVDRSPAADRADRQRVRPAHATAWRRSRDRQCLLCRSRVGRRTLAFGAVGPRPFVVASRERRSARGRAEARPPHFGSARPMRTTAWRCCLSWLAAH